MIGEVPVNNQELKKLGLKATLPRLKILHILEHSANRHLSAEEVHKLLLDGGDDVGLATVYRVLTQFEEAGLIRRHHFEGGLSVFELDNSGHHDHLVCVQCGSVVEFVDALIEKQQIAVAERFNFKMTDHALYIFGYCSTCSAPSSQEST
jgi:Fur family ferric uptake transcriptional regulator